MVQVEQQYLDFITQRMGELAKVKEAAIAVCQIRYSDRGWDELNEAIGQLIYALQKAGVKFNNPRIGEL